MTADSMSFEQYAAHITVLEQQPRLWVDAMLDDLEHVKMPEARDAILARIGMRLFFRFGLLGDLDAMRRVPDDRQDEAVSQIARPYWTSKDNPPYTLGPNFVNANQGNWQQGKADPAEPLKEPRYIFVWTLDGNPWYGVAPPTSSPPEVHFQGEGHSTAEVPVGKHHVTFTIYAGTLTNYPPPTGSVYEWGGGNVIDESPYTVGLDITVGPAPPSPLDELRAGVVQLEGSLAYRLKWSNVLAGTRKCRDALTRLGG